MFHSQSLGGEGGGVLREPDVEITHNHGISMIQDVQYGATRNDFRQG